MQVSANTNNFQNMNIPPRQPQEPTPMPIVVPSQDDRFNEGVYEASHGNVINTKDGSLTLTPQGENNVANQKAENTQEQEALTQAQQDQKRENGADYLAHKSMQSQVEIYMAVAKDSGDDTMPGILETLRDVQKQNEAVEAYATYEENQKSTNLLF